ncbi:MAG: hypothetical protein IKN49_03830 [Elusimicrobiaceae bacterium]|nr:hypothetical protein [Elusimicrobiaceae bacterium]
MKKIVLLISCIAISLSAWAYEGTSSVKQKIKKLALLEEKAFSFQEFEADDADYPSVLKLAQKTYEQNPNSFNAAYNYGMLLCSSYIPEGGPAADKETLEKALEVFEQAGKLSSSKQLMLSEREYDVLKQILLGTEIPFRTLVDEEIFGVFVKSAPQARQLQNKVKDIFQLSGTSVNMKDELWQDKAVLAFLSSLALQDYKQAAHWVNVLGGEKAMKKMWLENYGNFSSMLQPDGLNKKQNLKGSDLQKSYYKALLQIELYVPVWQKEETARRESVFLRMLERWLQQEPLQQAPYK